MATTQPSRAEDMVLLDLLDRHLLSGETQASVAASIGVHRGAIAGKLDRTVRAADKIPYQCSKPENKDGGMPPDWWR